MIFDQVSIRSHHHRIIPRDSTLTLTRAANFIDEIGKMDKIFQKDCGQEIRLIFISGPSLSMAHVANVTQANKDCVEKAILANLGVSTPPSNRR